MNLIAALLIAAAITLPPQAATPPSIAIDHVDLIEVNSYYDEFGTLVFDQAIFYEWVPRESRYHVIAWRLIKLPQQIPYFDHQQKKYITCWHDGDLLRQVTADQFRRSWTQYDPELIEREYRTKDRRLELSELIFRRFPNPDDPATLNLPDI